LLSAAALSHQWHLAWSLGCDQSQILQVHGALRIAAVAAVEGSPLISSAHRAQRGMRLRGNAAAWHARRLTLPYWHLSARRVGVADAHVLPAKPVPRRRRWRRPAVARAVPFLANAAAAQLLETEQGNRRGTMAANGGGTPCWGCVLYPVLRSNRFLSTRALIRTK
jgi:hypothetical protein